MSATVPAVRPPRARPKPIAYNISKAAAVAGLPKQTLYTWIRRGHFSVPSVGKGVEQQLTLGQVMLVCALAEMTRFGFLIDRAAEILQPINGELLKLFENTAERLGWLVIYDGKAKIVSDLDNLFNTRWRTVFFNDLDRLFSNAASSDLL